MTDLIPAPQWSSANGVNDAGQVAGTYNGSHLFLWEDRVLTDLGGLGANGTSGGYALGINDAGQVFGSSFIDAISES